MKYDDARLLLRYAKLQLEIAVAKNPTAEMNLDETLVHRSVGYKKLRAWFRRMSPRKRVEARYWLRQQCDGIDKMKKVAVGYGLDPKAALAEIEIIHRDDKGNEVEALTLPDARAASGDGQPLPEELEFERHAAEMSKESLFKAMREGAEAIHKTGNEKP